MISVGQIKAARSMLNLKQTDLAARAGISIATLNNLERGAQTDPKISTMRAIRQALEKEGIEFTSDALGGAGIMLKTKRAQTAAASATILIVDDDKADRALCRGWLGTAQGRKYRILESGNARDGFDAYAEHRPDCVIVDFMMQGMDGFQFLAMLKRQQDRLSPVIFISGMHREQIEQQALAHGAQCYLSKHGLTQDKLCRSLDHVLQAPAL